MQLTNILRDMGEDLRMGRVYLPEDSMARHGVGRELLEMMARGEAPISPGYRSLLEELMEEADRDYQRAFLAIPRLPLYFQRPVAVAARVYQAIHQEIRRNGYENLTRRARTSLLTKIRLGAGALMDLRELRKRTGPEDLLDPSPGPGLESEESLGVVA
jgi:phytoene synthase